MDLMRCVVNATGWWDDLHGLNPLGARPIRSTATSTGYGYYGEAGPLVLTTVRQLAAQCTCVEIPDATDVAHDPDNGVYTNGGRLYHFESANRYGVFIIRDDGKIYVPFAKKKGSTYEGFGDTCLLTKGLDPSTARCAPCR